MSSGEQVSSADEEEEEGDNAGSADENEAKALRTISNK